MIDELIADQVSAGLHFSRTVTGLSPNCQTPPSRCFATDCAPPAFASLLKSTSISDPAAGALNVSRH